VNGEVLAAVIGLSLNSLAWPVLFAFRRVSFTAWPPKPAPAEASPSETPAASPAASPRPLQSPTGRGL
jgi:hypothetical protein